MNPFQRATKHAANLRLAISGPSGSGKTYTALSIACTIAAANGSRVAFIDTEHGSAEKYADLFEFDVVNLPPPYHPDNFVKMISAAIDAGYKVLVIDSLTHAWNGPGGIMEIVDAEVAKQKTSNSYTAWAKATPIHQRLIDKIVSSSVHIIATMRSKTDYVLEKNEKTGKSVPRKVGMAPIQRDGMEYEFDVWVEMDIENRGLVQKSRCPAINGGVYEKPGADFAEQLIEWLGGAEPVKADKVETWGQKIDGAKAYLDKAGASTEENWQKARKTILDKVDNWPDPHKQAVNDHANTVAKQRGEDEPTSRADLLKALM